jgi:hypothetical protein
MVWNAWAGWILCTPLSFLFLNRDFSTITCYSKCSFPLHPLPLIICRLLDAFDAVPGHLTEDLHLYSLNDLTATKKGELGPRLAELTRAGAAHVERCMVRKSRSTLHLSHCLGIQGSCHLVLETWNGQLTLREKLERVAVLWVGE